MVESFLSKGATAEEAVRRTALRLRGAQAVAAAFRSEPERVIAFRVRNAGGIAVGYGDGEMLLASDLPAIIPHTQRVAFLSAGEWCRLRLTRPSTRRWKAQQWRRRLR